MWEILWKYFKNKLHCEKITTFNQFSYFRIFLFLLKRKMNKINGSNNVNEASHRRNGDGMEKKAVKGKFKNSDMQNTILICINSKIKPAKCMIHIAFGIPFQQLIYTIRQLYNTEIASFIMLT